MLVSKLTEKWTSLLSLRDLMRIISVLLGLILSLFLVNQLFAIVSASRYFLNRYFTQLFATARLSSRHIQWLLDSFSAIGLGDDGDAAVAPAARPGYG